MPPGRKVAAVEEIDLGIGFEANPQVIILRGKNKRMSCGNGRGDDELAAATVVEGRESEDLRDLLADRTHFGRSGRVFREDIRHAVHQEGLAEICRREELHVHSRLADKALRDRIVEIDGHGDTLVLAGHLDRGLESIVGVVEHDRYGILFLVDSPGLQDGIDIPLLGGVHQANAAARGDTDAAEDDLDGGGLLVTEHTRVVVAVNEEVDTGILEILKVIDFEVLS